MRLLTTRPRDFMRLVLLGWVGCAFGGCARAREAAWSGGSSFPHLQRFRAGSFQVLVG